MSGPPRPLADLAADPRNPRGIGAASAAGLGASMHNFGDIAGIVWNRRTGQLVAGHQRVAQLAAVGAVSWTELGPDAGYIEHPATGERFPVRIVDWGPAEQTAANLAANNPEIAGHFTEALPALLAEVQRGLPELYEKLRFDALARLAPRAAPVVEDVAPEPPVEAVARAGDLWTLGVHRLLCGDATNAEDVARVMAGERAEACITDPPYNVGKEYGEGTDDVKTRADFVTWCRCWFVPLRKAVACIVLTPGIVNVPEWLAIERTHGIIAWVKENQCSRNYLGVPSGFNVWEPVLVYGRASKCVPRDSFSVPIALQSDTGAHPCPKPVKAWAWLVEAFSGPGALLYEPFGGSGTSLVVAEQLGRRCFALEIEPTFVDVAVRRWENLTGRHATLDGDGRAFADVARSRGVTVP